MDITAMRKPATLANEELIAMLNLRKEGTPWSKLAEVFHLRKCTIYQSIRSKCIADKGLTKLWNEAAEATQSKPIFTRSEGVNQDETAIEVTGSVIDCGTSVPLDNHASITSQLMGDPTPKRQALLAEEMVKCNDSQHIFDNECAHAVHGRISVAAKGPDPYLCERTRSIRSQKVTLVDHRLVVDRLPNDNRTQVPE